MEAGGVVNIYPILNRLSIQDRDTGIVAPWKRNWAQNEYIETFQTQWNQNKPVRIIVLKARQLGISTATGGLMFSLSFIHNDRNSLIVAHEMDSSEHLLGMSQRYWRTYPFSPLYTPKYVSKKHLEWVETGSSIKVITAGNKDSGRSRTIHYLHASEVAFWDEAADLMLGLNQTVPNAPHTFIALESTANGIGDYFYDQWNAAVAGDTEYIPLFFPWWKHPDYTGTHIHLSTTLTNPSDDEKLLRKLGVSDDSIVWRRWAIPNLCGGDIAKFNQEYPSSPEEAFISTGHNVFPIGPLTRVYEKMNGRRGRLHRDATQPNGIRFQPDASGPLTIFSPPSIEDRDWGRYMIGGDPTHTTRGDPAVAQVINRRNYRQVAIFRGRVDPSTFAEELAKLGAYYNDAMIATESTGPGYATIGALVNMEYPHLWKSRWADKTPGIVATTYGWQTTHKSKEWAIGFLLKIIIDSDLQIHDSTTFTELRDYVSLEHGGYGPASNSGNDDTVMSLAICCIAAATDTPLAPYGAGLNPTSISITPDQAMDPSYWEGN